MVSTIKVQFEDGVFIPLGPVRGLQDGDILEFRLPDPHVIYLCEADRLAALESGRVVRVEATAQGADPSDA